MTDGPGTPRYPHVPAADGQGLFAAPGSAAPHWPATTPAEAVPSPYAPGGAHRGVAYPTTSSPDWAHAARTPMGAGAVGAVGVAGHGEGHFPNASPWPAEPKAAPAKVRLTRGALAAVVVLGMASGVVGAVAVNVFDGGRSTVTVQAAPTQVPVDRLPDSVAGVAARVLPSVVSLEVSGATGSSTGSGFILSADGHILTNNHVVAGAVPGGTITILLADGTKETATIVGRTSNYDLAVVKIERTGLVPLVLGDSDAIMVGDPVIAVGAPLGLTGTVTTGIISARNRPVTAGTQDSVAFINAMQTDAAINPGNSGGPLVNSAGEVIGINSAIAQPPGTALQGGAGSIGLGFAIPSNQAQRTATQLIETGEATYPIIGVLLDQRYTGEGVRVLTDDQAQGQPAVTPDGPADRAGIRGGDVIVAIDGRPVTDSDELVVAIRAKAPGDQVVLTLRDSRGVSGDREVTMVLDEAVSD